MNSTLKPIQVIVAIMGAVIVLGGVMFLMMRPAAKTDAALNAGNNPAVNNKMQSDGRPPSANLPAGAPRLYVPSHKKTIP